MYGLELDLNAAARALGVSLVSAGVVGTTLALLTDWAVRRWRSAEAKPGWGEAYERAGLAAPDSKQLPGISVLRPVKGLDVGFQENLEALVSQGYPIYEVLVGAESPDDPALSAARDVARRSRVPVRVVVCSNRAALNPKVGILEVLAREARHDAVLISDSNVRVRPGYLADLGRRLTQPKVGLVTNIVIGEAPGTFAAVLEILQLVTFVARATCFARVFVGRDCVVGKSMLFRLSDWNRLGGFARVRHVLAEDYVMGYLFAAAGFRVDLSPEPVPVPLPNWTFQQLFNRHLRWAQMRRRVSPSAFVLEPLLHPSPMLVSGVVICAMQGIELMVDAGIGCLALRLLLDALLINALHPRSGKWWWCLAVPLKDCFAMVVWATGGVKRTLIWRGKRLVIGDGSRLERQGVETDSDDFREMPGVMAANNAARCYNEEKVGRIESPVTGV